MPSQSSRVPKADNYGVESRKTNPETKNLPKKLCFLDNFSQETRLDDFSFSPKVTWTFKRCWRLVGDTHSSRFFLAMRVVVNYCKGQKQLKKKCFTSKEYLGQNTYLRASVPWKDLNWFSRQSSGYQEAQLTFIDCATGWKVLGRVDKSQRNLRFDNFGH